MRLIPILALTLSVMFCTTAKTTEEIRDRDWTLVSVDGATIPSGGTTPSIRFGTDNRLSANTGCNSASSDYTLSGDALTIGMMISTKRACVEPQRNELERAYMNALASVKRFRVTNGELELLNGSGAVVARFR